MKHVPVRRIIRVRDLGLDLPPMINAVVVRTVGGQPRLVLPSGELVAVGERLVLPLERARLCLALVPAEHVLLPRRPRDNELTRSLALAASLHVVLLLLAIFGRRSAAEEEGAARAAMAGYLTAIEQRSAEVNPSAPVEAAGAATVEAAAAAAAAAATREEGARGSVARTTEVGRGRSARGDAKRATSGEKEAATFGLIGLLGGDTSSARSGTSAFESFDGPSAMGNIFGTTIQDAAGLGGLGLSGIGEGGGGLGAGVPQNGVGIEQSGTCDATCQGALRGRRATRAPSIRFGHATKSPFLRCGDAGAKPGSDSGPCEVQITGRLPPEVIQRVVRQNFGRFRACYELGLRAGTNRMNPALEGRVSVKFVIDREGAVAMAHADGDLPDSEVKACVARAYQSMTFPKPEGGIVTVVYPIFFSPG